VVVGSLLTAYARGKPDQQFFARDMITRLNGLGIAQTMKAEAGRSCLLDALAPALLEPYSTPHCQIGIDVEADISMDQPQVDALALVLGELAVNSIKHGALGGVGGVELKGALVDDRIEVRWSERSDRPVTRRSREGGQGLALITRVLAARGGGIELTWLDHGLDVDFHMAAA